MVTDERHPADLLEKGHIDGIIRKAVEAGKSAITGIQMATIQAAQCFGLRDVGAVAPGYRVFTMRPMYGEGDKSWKPKRE